MKRPNLNLDRYKKDLKEILEGSVPQSVEDEIYLEMMLNIAQLRDEKPDTLDTRLLNTAFKELRYAMKIFKPYRSIPKAAVFGSARTPKNHPSYVFAEEFGKKVAKKGWMIITGGASGIMEAAMVGAGAKNSFGLNIMLPFEQDANPVIKGNEKLVYFKYFFTRKLMFLKESEATVLFPGGFGTFDEGFESFTLVQTGKAKPRPLVLVDPPGTGYWKSLMEHLKVNMEDEHLISKGDLTLMRHFQDTELAADELVNFYKNYHSSRFLKERYLIHTKKKISDAALKHINEYFKDILADGVFERLADIGEDDNKSLAVDRLVFHFNRSGYSRLRQLIDYLNTL